MSNAVSEKIKNTAPPEPPSEREAIFGKRNRYGNGAGVVPDDFKDSPRGTAYLPNKVNFPGGPGWSDRFSGPAVMSPDGAYPIGIWYFPAVTGHHANVGGYFIPASGGIVIQIKKPAG